MPAAVEQGTAAARTMLGRLEPYAELHWFWSDQYDLNLQIAGLPDEGRRVVRRPLKDGAFILCHLKEDGTLVGASGVGRGNLIARDVKLLELLIGKKAQPAEANLADPEFQLRTLLKG